MCRCRSSIIVLFSTGMALFTACDERPVYISTSASVSVAAFTGDSIAERRIADSIAVEHSRLLATSLPLERKLQFQDHDDRYPCLIENPDTMVHNVILCDINSSLNVLGNHWELIEDNIDMPHQNYSNAHGSQFLTCFFHYGGVRYGYSEFEVSYSCKEPKVKARPDEEFISGNGVHLGLHKDSVIAIAGTCYMSDTTNGNLVIKYIADDYLNNKFLQHWNYPKYYAEYEFKEDRLLRFRFGFEYP